MRAEFAAQQIRFAAIAVFGDRVAAGRWIDTPNDVLGGMTPAACAKTKPGLLQVMGVLNALETGAVV